MSNASTTELTIMIIYTADNGSIPFTFFNYGFLENWKSTQ